MILQRFGVISEYGYRGKLSRALSAACLADQRGFGEIVIPNKIPTTEHTKN